MRSGDHLSQKFWGIFIKKERWGLSWRGWLLVTSAGLAYGLDAALARHVPAWFAKRFMGVSPEDAYGVVRNPTVTSGVATATVP